MTQYKWVIIFYHACKESCRTYSEQLFDSEEECRLEGERVLEKTDFCCGIGLEVVAIES